MFATKCSGFVVCWGVWRYLFGIVAFGCCFELCSTLVQSERLQLADSSTWEEASVWGKGFCKAAGTGQRKPKSSVSTSKSMKETAEERTLWQRISTKGQKLWRSTISCFSRAQKRPGGSLLTAVMLLLLFRRDLKWLGRAAMNARVWELVAVLGLTGEVVYPLFKRGVNGLAKYAIKCPGRMALITASITRVAHFWSDNFAFMGTPFTTLSSINL